MKLEDQVCSLELSKRLKELGVWQDSYFIWTKAGVIPRTSIMGLDKHEMFEPNIYAAFTVAELGNFLWVFESDVVNGYGEDLAVSVSVLSKCGYSACSSTEANARAKMLIYLLENKLMEVPK